MRSADSNEPHPRYYKIGMTDLHEAASNGDLLQLEEAIKQGQDIDEPDMDWGRRTPLHVACAVGSKKCAYVLLTKGCKPNVKTDSGWTPAHFACEGGKVFSFFKSIMCIILSKNNTHYFSAWKNSHSFLLQLHFKLQVMCSVCRFYFLTAVTSQKWIIMETLL